MAVKGTDALDGYLIMAHGSSAKEIASRHDPPTRFMTTTQAMVMKAYGHEATFAGKTENPAEIVRTEKLQAKARMDENFDRILLRVFSKLQHALGLDPWDPLCAAIPEIPKTVTPKLTPAIAMAAVPAADTTAAARFAPTTSTALESTVSMTGITAGAGAAPEFARQGGFTREFHRGLSGIGSAQGSAGSAAASRSLGGRS